MARLTKPKYPPRPAGKMPPKGEKDWANYYTSLAAQFGITKGMSTDDMPDAFLADIFNYAFKAEIDWDQIARLRAQENASTTPAADTPAIAPAPAKKRAEKAPALQGAARSYTPKEARALDPRSPENMAKHPHREPTPAKPKTKRISKAEMQRLAGITPDDSRRDEPAAPLIQQLDLGTS